MYNVQCTMYNVQYSVHSICTLYIMFIIINTINVIFVRCTNCNLHLEKKNVQLINRRTNTISICTMFVLYIVHCTLC